MNDWGDIVKALEMRQYDRLLLLPEFRRLVGVKQLARTHHEDVWRHTCLTIAAAQNLTDDPMVWWAAACHDLGKGVGFVSRIVGIHTGHDRRGGPIVARLCKRLRLHPPVTQLAHLAALWHMKIAKAHRYGTVRQIDILLAVDALGQPGRLEQLLKVCEADAKGRDSRAYKPPPTEARETLTRVLKVLRPSVV